MASKIVQIIPAQPDTRSFIPSNRNAVIHGIALMDDGRMFGIVRKFSDTDEFELSTPICLPVVKQEKDHE